MICESQVIFPIRCLFVCERRLMRGIGLLPDGLTVFEASSIEFKAITDYFNATALIVLDESLPAKGHELLELMRTDVQAFFRKLCLNNVIASPFFDIPVLSKIAPEVFVDRVIALDPITQSSVFSMFQGRYERGTLNDGLKDEKPWLDEVTKVFERKMESLPPMSRHRLKTELDTR
jgi:hypothetical protein